MSDTLPDVPAEPPGGLDERFCEAMDAAPVMIWVSGADKLCTWLNKPWLVFTGRSMEQQRGNGWAESIHPDDVERRLEIMLSRAISACDHMMGNIAGSTTSEFRATPGTGLFCSGHQRLHRLMHLCKPILDSAGAILDSAGESANWRTRLLRIRPGVKVLFIDGILAKRHRASDVSTPVWTW